MSSSHRSACESESRKYWAARSSMRSSGPKRAPVDDDAEPFLSGDDDPEGELGARGGAADERVLLGDCDDGCDGSSVELDCCGKWRDELDAPGPPTPGCSMLLNQPPMRLATLLFGLSGTAAAGSDDGGGAGPPPLDDEGSAELVGVTPLDDDDRSSSDVEPAELGCA